MRTLRLAHPTAIQRERLPISATRTGKSGSLTLEWIVFPWGFHHDQALKALYRCYAHQLATFARRQSVAFDLSYHPPLLASSRYRCHKTAGPMCLDHSIHHTDADLSISVLGVRRVGNVLHFHAAPLMGFAPTFLLISATGHFRPAPLHVRTRPAQANGLPLVAWDKDKGLPGLAARFSPRPPPRTWQAPLRAPRAT